MSDHLPVLVGKSKDGRVMHYASGAIIGRDGKFFLEDRAIPPFGFAAPAGHIDVGEDAEKALMREVQEETGLKITNYMQVFEEEVGWNTCSMGVEVHYWHVYLCEAEGDAKLNDESKGGGWFSKDEIRKMKEEKKIEPIWEYWLGKMGFF